MMDNVTKAKQFIIDYFNKHELNKEDDEIDESNIELLSFLQAGLSWKMVFSMPYGLIYKLETTERNDGTVYFTKYNRVGCSLYLWKDED